MHSSLVEFVSDVWEAACIIGKLVRTGREHDWKAPCQGMTEHGFSRNKGIVIFLLKVLLRFCSYSVASNCEICLKSKLCEEKEGSKCSWEWKIHSACVCSDMPSHITAIYILCVFTVASFNICYFVFM